MPKPTRITKESILNAALEIVRESGTDMLNARSLALRLGCSTQPIFSNFTSMDEVKSEVGKQAYGLYEEFLNNAIEHGKYPPYKEAGMAYIRFAAEEKQLFRLLFMRDRTGADKSVDLTSDTDVKLISMIASSLSVPFDAAKKFHRESWIFVHGIATMVVTSFADYREDDISAMLTDVYVGLSMKIKEDAK